MKRILISLICFLTIAVFCAGCGGVYTPPIITGPGETQGGEPGGGNPGETPEEGYTFTVSLVSNGKPYEPVPGQNIKAHWTGDDGHSNYEAAFNPLGVASCSGMDGDFRVTLSDIPSGYTYNPNGIYANNNHRDVEVELLAIQPLSGGKGTGLYDCFSMNRTGTYRAEVESAEQIIYYEFTPSETGKYFIESWVDISANEINPKINYHRGTIAWKNTAYIEYDSGGTASTYTKNFRLVAECAPAEVGSSWCFGLHVDCVSDELYPATVDFTISYEGEASDPEGVTVVAESNGPYYSYDETGKFTEFASLSPVLDDFDAGYNEDDGYYHLYNEETGKYDGAMVYVMLTNNTYYFDSYVAEDCNDSFRHCDYFHPEWSDPELYPDGHLHYFPLRLGIGDINYDEFYFKDYCQFISIYTGYYRETDASGSPTIVYHDDLRKCNRDGAHPVNEELKTFLQEYAKHYSVFHDGDGGGEQIGLNSSEESMWLFACGIYL